METKKTIPAYACDCVDEICTAQDLYLKEHSKEGPRKAAILAAANAAAATVVAKLLLERYRPSDSTREAVEYLADEIVLAKTGVISRHDLSTATDGGHRNKPDWSKYRWSGPPLPIHSRPPIDCTIDELFAPMEDIIDLLIVKMVKFVNEIREEKKSDTKITLDGRGYGALAAYIAISKLLLKVMPADLASFIETIAESRMTGMIRDMDQRCAMPS